MIPTVNPEPYAEVDFMLHSPIFNRGTTPISSWPAPPPRSQSQRFSFKLQPGQCFRHIDNDSILGLLGTWFSHDKLQSVHLKIFFLEDDADHAVDIHIIDTRYRRVKFFSENGAYLPDTLLYYQNAHKSNVLDLYLHHNGRFWIELRPE